MENIHFGEDSRAIIGNEDLARGELHEFVHASRPEGRSDGGGDRLDVEHTYLDRELSAETTQRQTV